MRSLLTIIALCTASLGSLFAQSSKVELWVTRGDQSALLKREADLVFQNTTSINPVIEVDTAARFQTMEGFGFALTDGSAQVISQLKPADQTRLLTELFSPAGPNISYLRISIGASDLSNHVYTYDDMPAGETDPELRQFSLAPQKTYLIPMLKEILRINPELRLMGSPWSPPAWMKTNGSSKGGQLKPAYYHVYANYFVKYIQAMVREGINIDAITVQNEPENPDNNPSLLMTSKEESEFIQKYLGPAFRSANIKTKILLFDHNCDHPNYPLEILNDAATREFVAGTAFHLYLGEVTAMGLVHQAFPDKSIYFTEQWTGANGTFSGDLDWHVRTLIISATRNWSRTVLEWNLAADENYKPFTPGGCSQCKGALTIHSSTKEVTRNVSYYIIAQASKFVPAGSVRIGSTSAEVLPNVAFQTPSGKKVVIVINNKTASESVTIGFNHKQVNKVIEPGTVATFVW